MDRINVLHCGGKEDLRFIEHLNKAISSARTSLTLEYRQYQLNQNREATTYHDAERYKSDKLPCIVLVSQEFFELLWKTSYKNPLLNIICTNSMKKCLHIWLDVDEKDVKMYSNRLLSENLNFRRLKAYELTNSSSSLSSSSSPQVINTICGLFEDTCGYSTLENYDMDDKEDDMCTLENYDVDDEEDNMRDSFKNKYFPETGMLPQTLLEVETVVKKKRVKKKADIYKDVLRMSSMNPEELEAISTDRPPHMQTPSRRIPQQNTSRHPTQQNSVPNCSENTELNLSIPRHPASRLASIPQNTIASLGEAQNAACSSPRTHTTENTDYTNSSVTQNPQASSSSSDTTPTISTTQTTTSSTHTRASTSTRRKSRKKK